jgi:PKD repeat protein
VDCTNNATVVNVIGDATGGTAPYTFSWDFGDRSPNTAGPSASHSYALVGSYVVTLNVTDAAGVSALNESSIAIDPWSCPTGSTPPTVSTPSTAGWATPTNLALLALGVGIAALVAFLVLRRYRR